LSIIWFHPLGSLADQVDGEFKALIVDVAKFRERGGERSARASGITTVYTLGSAEYGLDLLRAAEYR
jgi:fatty-acyl-CoA synthase